MKAPISRRSLIKAIGTAPLVALPLVAAPLLASQGQSEIQRLYEIWNKNRTQYEIGVEGSSVAWGHA